MILVIVKMNQWTNQKIKIKNNIIKMEATAMEAVWYEDNKVWLSMY